VQECLDNKMLSQSDIVRLGIKMLSVIELLHKKHCLLSENFDFWSVHFKLSSAITLDIHKVEIATPGQK
jgi:hypothetical protein